MARARISTVAAAFALASLLAAPLTLPGSAAAQARVEEKVNVAVTGDIVAIDAPTRVIVVRSTNDKGVVYVADASATILKGATTLKLEDLQTGWNVAINGHDDGETKLITMIKVVKAP
jgi:hypothetical protein